MKIPYRGLCKNLFHIGSGEVIGRLCSVATVVLLGHRHGVVILGVYALAQSLNQYLQPVIDFGLRQVGARLLALYPQTATDIVLRVQRRRLGMVVLVLPAIALYAAYAKLPAEMKIFLFAFSAGGTLYAISLDWVAWGQEKLYLLGLARSVVPASILVFLSIGSRQGDWVLWWAVGGNAFGFLLQALIFRTWWRKQPSQPAHEGTLHTIREGLGWRRTSIMGLANFCSLAFNSIDVLMLGLMSNPKQVGLYGASYRVLNQVLATYYLLNLVLYPRFARHEIKDRARMLRTRILLSLFGAGVLLAVIVSISRRAVLTIMFGHQFLAASPLLILLAWSIPLDFMTSYLSNAFIAWGMEKKVLLCTGIGAASNILLNLVFIPSRGARGAAVNTLLSYAIFLTALFLTGRRAGELGSRTELLVDSIAYT